MSFYDDSGKPLMLHYLVRPADAIVMFWFYYDHPDDVGDAWSWAQDSKHVLPASSADWAQLAEGSLTTLTLAPKKSNPDELLSIERGSDAFQFITRDGAGAVIAKRFAPLETGAAIFALVASALDRLAASGDSTWVDGSIQLEARHCRQ